MRDGHVKASDTQSHTRTRTHTHPPAGRVMRTEGQLTAIRGREREGEREGETERGIESHTE